VCIGAKAARVAFKEWNQLPATGGGRHEMSGDSYETLATWTGMNWRHVKFIEQFSEDRSEGRWLMMSDVCKHALSRLSRGLSHRRHSSAPSSTPW